VLCICLQLRFQSLKPSAPWFAHTLNNLNLLYVILNVSGLVLNPLMILKTCILPLIAMAGIPGRLMDRLQSVLNAAARLVFSARKYDHITPLLRELHWLTYHERIAYRLAALAFRCQHSLAPSYLSDELRRESDDDSRRRLYDWYRRQFWSFRGQSTARSVTALCPSLRRKYGTLCRLTSHVHPHCRHSNGD